MGVYICLNIISDRHELGSSLYQTNLKVCMYFISNVIKRALAIVVRALMYFLFLIFRNGQRGQIHCSSSWRLAYQDWFNFTCLA